MKNINFAGFALLGLSVLACPMNGFALEICDVWGAEELFTLKSNYPNIGVAKAQILAGTEGFKEIQISGGSGGAAKFAETGLQQGDELIIVRVNPGYKVPGGGGGYPNSANLFLLTSEVLVVPNVNYVLFRAYDFSQQKERLLRMQCNESMTLSIKKKSEFIESPMLSSNKVVNQYRKMGYEWSGPHPDYVDVYAGLRPGDELVFQDAEGKTQRLLVRETDRGVRSFLNLDTFQASYSYSTPTLNTAPTRMTPVQLQAMVTPGTLLVRKNPVVLPPYEQDPNWLSQVQEFQARYNNVADAVSRTNLTQMAQTNPRGVQDILTAGAIAYANTQWRIALTDLKNIKAIRGMNEDTRFLPTQVLPDELMVTKDDWTILNVKPIAGKPLLLETYEVPNRPKTRRARILKSPDGSATSFFEVQVASKEDGEIVYAHLLESAYGYSIESAQHPDQITDLRMDQEAYRTSRTLQGRRWTETTTDRREPIFLGEVTHSPGQGTWLRIKFYDGWGVSGSHAEFIWGLLWAHHLRL